MTIDQIMLEAQLLKTRALDGPPEDLLAVERATITRLLTRLEELDGQHGTEVIQSFKGALEDCRLYAARNASEPWAKEVLRICAIAGLAGTPIRSEESP